MIDKIKAFLLTAIIYGALIGIFVLMIFIGYEGVTSGNLFYTLGGIVILSSGLFMPLGFFLKEDTQIGDVVAKIFGYSMVIGLYAIWGFIGIGLIILPFTNTDLSIDLGILIVKSGFVKFCWVIGDAILLFYMYKWVVSFAQKKFNRKKNNQNS